MEGAIRKTEKAGVVIAGGHTLSDREPKFGLAVTGFADKDSVWTNKGVKAGDSIVLTKKLGVGLLMTAHKAGETEAVEAIAQMRKLNKEAKENASGLEIHAATDVTGFSLIGHSYEAAYASGVSAVISFERLRYLEGAEKSRFPLTSPPQSAICYSRLRLQEVFFFLCLLRVPQFISSASVMHS